MRPRPAVVLWLSLVVLLRSGLAHAWQEAHQIADDATARVDASGHADVEHSVQWRVVHGPFTSFDLTDVDPGITLDPDVTVLAADGRSDKAHAVRGADGNLRVTVDDPRGLSRGVVVFRIRWRVDLRASELMAHDGNGWKLAWTLPRAADGYDSGSLALDLPAGSAAPVLLSGESGDDGSVSTLQRGPGRDVLTIVRPHVVRGESVTWAVLVDAGAFPALNPAPSTETPQATGAVGHEGIEGFVFWTGLVVLGAAYAILMARAGHRGAGARAPACASDRLAIPFVPLPAALRGLLGGAAVATGVYLQIREDPTVGGMVLAGAILLAACRSPQMDLVVVGSGRWLPLRPEEVFPGVGGSRLKSLVRRYFGADRWLGMDRGSLALYVLASACLLAELRDQSPVLGLADGCVFLPIWVSARFDRLSPPRGAMATAWLSSAFRRLGKQRSLHVVPWGRIGVDGSIEEVRVLTLPRSPLPGLIGIEIGLAWSNSPSGPIATPEVLVRVKDGSVAGARLAACAIGVAPTGGRAPGERVTSLLPRLPTQKATLALVRRIATVLADRRVTSMDTRWSRSERRVDPTATGTSQGAQAVGGARARGTEGRTAPENMLEAPVGHP